MAAPSSFPTFPGLDIAVVKRPKWSTGRAVAASGRDVRVGYWSSPLWEFDLTFNFLRDDISPSELKALIGFYNSTAGGLTGFLLKDPTDHAVTGQSLGTGDGTTTRFPLVRTYGGTSGTGTERVGYVDASQPFHVYVAGTLQTTGYTLNQAAPVYQTVDFASAPAAGAAISADFSFAYYVHFKDDTADFEQLVWQIFQVRKLTLESLRG